MSAVIPANVLRCRQYAIADIRAELDKLDQLTALHLEDSMR